LCSKGVVDSVESLAVADFDVTFGSIVSWDGVKGQDEVLEEVKITCALVGGAVRGDALFDDDQDFRLAAPCLPTYKDFPSFRPWPEWRRMGG